MGQESQLGTTYKCWKHEDGDRNNVNSAPSDSKKCFAVKHAKKCRYYHIEEKYRNRIFGQMTDEICLVRTIKHKNIVQLIDIFEDKPTLYLVNELCTGGTLLEGIIQRKENFTSINEENVSKICKQLFNALSYMQDVHMICHLDLNPRNILFENTSEEANVKVM